MPPEPKEHNPTWASDVLLYFWADVSLANGTFFCVCITIPNCSGGVPKFKPCNSKINMLNMSRKIGDQILLELHNTDTRTAVAKYVITHHMVRDHFL
jgi:hypothetical protein